MTGDSTLRRYAGYGMKRAFNAIQADVNAALAPLGLRMITFSTLAVIAENPGLRQSVLAEILAMERPNLVVVVDELERAELISRQRPPEDRRAYALRVTLAGQRLLDKALAAVDAHERRMTAGLTEEERQALIRALARVERNGRRDQDEPAELSRP